MIIQRTNIFNATIEGEKQFCSKCKRERKVIGMRLIQKKGKKYLMVVEQRCSYECKENKDQEYSMKEETLAKKEKKEQELGEKLDQALEELKETEEEEEAVVEGIEIKEVQTGVIASEGGVFEIPSGILSLPNDKKEEEKE